MTKWATVYEEFSEESAYEHINSELVTNIYIESEEDNYVFVTVEFLNDSKTLSYPFKSVKEARRFIKRVIQ